MKTLYLCYFGLREPLVQTQVLPYLRELRAGGIEVYLLTFEPDLRTKFTAEDRQTWQNKLAADGIRWSTLAYHKRPTLPATLFDIAQGALVASRLIRREKIDVVHTRSQIPALMGLMIQRATGCKFVFDVRGLIAEEYVDSGIWTEDSLTFRAVKSVERAAMKHADQLIVLTHRLSDYLSAQGLASADKIEVIPCCVDFTRGAELASPAQSGDDRFELVYAGSTSGLYLVEEMGKFFVALRARRPDAFFRVLTQGDPARVQTIFGQLGLPVESYSVGSAAPAEVPALLRRARLGVSFRKSTFSQIGASPTKIPEYLSVGLPVVCNAGIGDMDALVSTEKVGVVVSSFGASDLQRAVDESLALLEDSTLRDRCVRVARAEFDLKQVGGPRYRHVYQRLGAL